MHAASVAARGQPGYCGSGDGDEGVYLVGLEDPGAGGERRGEARAHDTGLELHFGHVPVKFCPVWTFQMTGTCSKTFRQAAYAARIRLAARFSALMTPRSDARTMDSLIPTPQ